MKAFAKVFGWMAILGAVVLYASISMAESLGAMRLVIEQGDVQVKIADTGEWVPASVNMPIVEGDELWVPASSRAALQTNNGAINQTSDQPAQFTGTVQENIPPTDTTVGVTA